MPSPRAPGPRHLNINQWQGMSGPAAAVLSVVFTQQLDDVVEPCRCQQCMCRVIA